MLTILSCHFKGVLGHPGGKITPLWHYRIYCVRLTPWISPLKSKRLDLATQYYSRLWLPLGLVWWVAFMAIGFGGGSCAISAGFHSCSS
ncbi:MAG: hypothetical protein ACK456_00205 [Pseudanabaenaceae cyanobacterium]